ncbi:MAG: formate dehydrogenase subunit alpha, partial [Candidatus Omnitrophica bacterium]|nr:formate dehydrogenase subunit alpha [Candidatus Omnitrophota bacterium]
HCARLCHAPTVAGLVQNFGSGAMTNSINEIKGAACLLAIGTNTTEAHPIIGAKIRQAVDKGTKLIIANPREIELCRQADIFMQHRAGTDVALLMGLMRFIVDEKLLDEKFIKQRCENFEEFKKSLKEFDLDTVEQITTVPKEKIIAAARMYAKTTPGMIFYSMGITQHSHGTDNVLATGNLAMLTGNIGKPSTGVNPLRGQNNVQGACDLGALPNVYSGYQKVDDPQVHEKFEKEWKAKLDNKKGLTLTEMFPAIDKGRIKAMYLVGENPLLSDADSSHVQESIEKLEFFVVQDIFLTETAQLADVVLPAATFAEKEGTFTNTERRVQRVRRAIKPIGDSRPDWQIVCDIAQAMESPGFDFKSPTEVMDEIAKNTPIYKGISYKRIKKQGLQWPCLDARHKGTQFLHKGKFSRGKGRFIPLKYKPSVELPDKDYPLLLTTGRSLYHFHTGTMTRKVKGLEQLKSREQLEISAGDAKNLGIKDKQKVKITSRRGQVEAQAKITRACPAGTVYMTFHFKETPTNILTSPALDPIAKIPETKVCAVRVEKL